MSWIQIKIDAPADREEQLSELLFDSGAVAVTFEDAADKPVYEPPPGETPLWSQTRIIGLFDANSVSSGHVIETMENALHLTLSSSVTPVEDKDWIHAWMDEFKPMCFGKQLWIYPSGCKPPEPNAVNIQLDPGLAFGTGTHPTTAMCLSWLDANPPENLDVIDYGCGSGVLSVAAALLGARHVWAIDYDPQAIVATKNNALKNDISERISSARPEALPAVKCDLLLANILADPLIELGHRFSELLFPGGDLILSGLLDDQAQRVVDAYHPWFRFNKTVKKEEWIRLDGQRLDN